MWRRARRRDDRRMNNINLANPVAVLAGLAIAGFVIYRQLQASPLNALRLVALPGLLAYGALQLSPALAGMDLVAGFLGGTGLLAGLAFGAARGFSVRTWTGADGATWTQGTWVTLALWGGLIAFRVGMGFVDHVAGIGGRVLEAELMWTLFATFAAQNAVTWIRATRVSSLVPVSR
jgi:hypothetical protein